jgi:uncharacterized membrane protein
MLQYAAAYGASLVTFLAVDFAWLSIMSSRVYKPALGDLLADKIAIAPGIIFYLIYIAGVTILAVAPALERGGLGRAAFAAAVLGLVAYATYDLTNQATLRTWATHLTLMDMAWGAAATTIAAVAGFMAAQALGSK